MKKTLLSLAVCASLAFGMGDKTAEVIDPGTLEKEINNAKKPKKQNMSYPKTSFFENKLAGGKNMIIDNPQGGERKK